MTRLLPQAPNWSPRWHRALAIAFGCTLAAGASLAAAQDEAEPDAPPPAAEESKFQLHGFLTQAYADSDGNQILGIDEDGTNRYRTAALQFRYDLTEDDSFTLQVAHEGLGESPISELREDVEIDWVFYRRRLTDATEIKVGKVPIPRGIYNELLDVGTFLPFYRPPSSIYGEGAFANEAVEGLVLSHSFFTDSDWPLDADVYYGGWEYIEIDGATGEADFANVEDGVGIQLWLRPPVDGLRIGVAAQRYLVSEGVLRPPGVQERWRNWLASVEWVFSRLAVRAEYLESTTDAATYTGYYAQVGIRVTPKLSLNLLAEGADLEIDVPFFSVDLDFDRSRGAGLSYAFRSNVVAKVEAHWDKGYLTEPPPSFFGPPVETNYGIVGLSVSF